MSHLACDSPNLAQFNTVAINREQRTASSEQPMVIVTLFDPQQKTPLRQWRFEHESLIKVGRAPDNHIVLSDPLVSRHHLELRKVEGARSPLRSQNQPGWRLANQSANGTFLNGYLVTQESLAGDVIIQLAQGGPNLRVQILPDAVPLAQPARQAPSLPKLSRLETSPQPGPPRSTCTHSGNLPSNLFCIHCGQPIQIEKVIHQYQVLKVLGKGGMGTTYLAWRPENAASSLHSKGTILVLKEMNADMACIPKARELFEREAAILKTLNHPGIPRFYDFFVEAGNKYLVMELVHGHDLERRVLENGPIAPEQAITWMLQVCEVLEYLHNRPVPIIHRDIKPGNLLARTITNQIVLLDFGAVKSVGMPPGTRIGAEGYSAPEQTQGRPVTQSDLYAIGPTLAFLLTGKGPQHFYKKSSHGYQFSSDMVFATPLLKKLPQSQSRLCKVMKRLTEPRPLDRYHTAKAVSIALADCL